MGLLQSETTGSRLPSVWTRPSPPHPFSVWIHATELLALLFLDAPFAVCRFRYEPLAKEEARISSTAFFWLM